MSIPKYTKNQLGIILEVAMGMSNLPSVIVTSFFGALGVSELSCILPEKVPVTLEEVRGSDGYDNILCEISRRMSFVQ
jgi:hypothetical protein